jgi:hypothetical protein
MRRKKPYIPIQTLLAYNATDAAVKLLKKYGYEPKNIDDIQVKLSEAYKAVPDKVEFEKALLEIHPHAPLFKKYFATPEITADKTVVEVAPKAEASKEVKNTVVHDGYSNAEGSPACSCSRCSYGLDGTGRPNDPRDKRADLIIGAIAIVGVVAIAGIIIKS